MDEAAVALARELCGSDQLCREHAVKLDQLLHGERQRIQRRMRRELQDHGLTLTFVQRVDEALEQ